VTHFPSPFSGWVAERSSVGWGPQAQPSKGRKNPTLPSPKTGRDKKGHRERDESRDRTLNEFGYRVLRFGNPEIDENIEGVLEAIRLALVADT